MFAPFLPHFGKIVSMEKTETVDFTGNLQTKQNAHRRHCIIETSNPNGFGAFFYKGLEFQWNFCGKLYDPKTRVLYIAFFIHINYYIVI